MMNLDKMPAVGGNDLGEKSKSEELLLRAAACFAVERDVKEQLYNYEKSKNEPVGKENYKSKKHSVSQQTVAKVAAAWNLFDKETQKLLQFVMYNHGLKNELNSKGIIYNEEVDWEMDYLKNRENLLKKLESI